MAYKYRNVKTKEIVTTSNKVTGKNWERVETTKQDPAADTITEVEETMEETTQEETAEVEDPAAPAKPSRKGKK